MDFDRDAPGWYAAAILLGVLNMLYEVFVAVTTWGWFVVPLGLPALPWQTALVFLVLGRTLTHVVPPKKIKAQDKDGLDHFTDMFSHTLGLSIALGLAWLLSGVSP